MVTESSWWSPGDGDTNWEGGMNCKGPEQTLGVMICALFDCGDGFTVDNISQDW